VEGRRGPKIRDLSDAAPVTGTKDSAEAGAKDLKEEGSSAGEKGTDVYGKS